MHKKKSCTQTYNFIDIHKKWGEAMKDALLDYIFDNCDAAYISDLRQKMIFQEYADMILEIEDTKFSVEEWNYVYRYLTGANAVFSAVAEVKEALRSWMQA